MLNEDIVFLLKSGSRQGCSLIPPSLLLDISLSCNNQIRKRQNIGLSLGMVSYVLISVLGRQSQPGLQNKSQNTKKTALKNQEKKKKTSKTISICRKKLGVMAWVFNPSTQEAQGDGSLSSRPASVSQLIPWQANHYQ